MCDRSGEESRTNPVVWENKLSNRNDHDSTIDRKTCFLLEKIMDNL